VYDSASVSSLSSKIRSIQHIVSPCVLGRVDAKNLRVADQRVAVDFGLDPLLDRQRETGGHAEGLVLLGIVDVGEDDVSNVVGTLVPRCGCSCSVPMICAFQLRSPRREVATATRCGVARGSSRTGTSTCSMPSPRHCAPRAGVVLRARAVARGGSLRIEGSTQRA
jgi:hypothetical protein